MIKVFVKAVDDILSYFIRLGNKNQIRSNVIRIEDNYLQSKINVLWSSLAQISQKDLSRDEKSEVSNKWKELNVITNLKVFKDERVLSQFIVNYKSFQSNTTNINNNYRNTTNSNNYRNTTNSNNNYQNTTNSNNELTNLLLPKLENYKINISKFDEWMNAHFDVDCDFKSSFIKRHVNTENMKRVIKNKETIRIILKSHIIKIAKRIRENTVLISFDTFLIGILDSFIDFFVTNKNASWRAVICKHDISYKTKSSYWVYNLLTHFGKNEKAIDTFKTKYKTFVYNKPNYNLIINKIHVLQEVYIPETPNAQHSVFFDDMSYTGGQLDDSIRNFDVGPKHLIIYGLGLVAYKLLKNRIRIYTNKIFKPLFDDTTTNSLFNDNYKIDYESLYSKLYNCEEFRINTNIPILFDHKVPDYLSSLPSVYINGNVANLCKDSPQIPFIESLINKPVDLSTGSCDGSKVSSRVGYPIYSKPYKVGTA
jgi:hypothetical protein